MFLTAGVRYLPIILYYCIEFSNNKYLMINPNFSKIGKMILQNFALLADSSLVTFLTIYCVYENYLD